MEALNSSMQRFLLFSIVLAIVATVSASASSCDAPNGFDADACEGYPDETLLLYPYNCNAYVNCTQECPVLNLCPPGKHFNEFLRICDTPASANCVEIPLPTTTTPKPTLPPGVDPECCRNLAPGSLLNIDGDCEQFVKCDKDEEPEVLKCPRGRVFNEEMDLCDFVFDAGCNLPGVTTTPAPATTTTFNPIDACENQIPGTQLPHPTNCQQYVICESDVIYTLGCPPNMWYDPQSQKCGSDVSPTACLALPPPYTTRPPTTKASRLFASNRTSPVYEHKICGTQTNGETVSYPGNCRKFIACEDPVPVAYYCQDEYWYDQQSKSCVPAVLSDCREPGWTVSPPPSTTPKPTRPPPKGPCDGLPDGTLIPYPNDCTKYITCTRPINVGYDCPEGLEFNAEKRQCMRPEEANCSIKTTTTVSTTSQRTTPSTPTPTTPTPTPTTTHRTTRPTPTPTTPKPTPTTPAPANACVNKIDGADLPYPKDCSKYIVCVKQEEMIVPCTAGNFYNPRTGICDKDGKSTCTA